MTQNNTFDFMGFFNSIGDMFQEQGMHSFRQSTEAWAVMETHVGRAQIEILNGLIKVTEKRLEDLENQFSECARENIAVE